MYHSKQQIKVTYPMTAPPSGPPPIPNSRGHTLFALQAQRNAPDVPISTNQTQSSHRDLPPVLPPLRSAASFLPPFVTPQHVHPSPSVIHRRLPLGSSESYPHSDNTNVQLISIQARPEANYIKELPTSSPVTKRSEKLQETDFPLVETPAIEHIEPTTHEGVMENYTTCEAFLEKAFDYLNSHDDDDDVVHQTPDPEQQYHSDSFDDDDDSVDTIDLPASIVKADERHESRVQTIWTDKQRDHHENLNDQSSTMACSSRETVSEDNDSDFDEASHEDDEQPNDKDSGTEQADEYQAQIIIRQQQILWGIVQEWIRKEASYEKQLEMMKQQISHNSIPSYMQDLVHQLLGHHKTVVLTIEDLCDRDLQPGILTAQIVKAIDKLMRTMPLYIEYIQLNLAPIRKALDKRINSKELSSEDLLSIPPKQFLEILAQVQDLYQTARSSGTGDDESIKKLYTHAHECKEIRKKQDENMNKIILKTEDVGIMNSRGHRDRCRLILYSDAIVCSTWRTKLLASPRCTLLWFIPMIDLQWTEPQLASDNKSDTEDNLKTHLKSAYKELEKAPKTNNVTQSRLSKSIRKQESEYNLAQSKLQLILSSSSSNSRPSASYTLLFSSNYQRQDWIDFIEKTQQDHNQRTAEPSEAISQQRLNDSLIQKRLDLVKPYSQDLISTDLPSAIRTSPENTQLRTPTKTYSGTLHITIHSIQGSVLCNPVRQHQTLPLMASISPQQQKNYQFFVAVEIDSYNTFYPYAQTAKQKMQHSDSVEFKDEEFHIELEYSLAFRLLIHRVDTTTSGHNNSMERATCIGKFHRDIETTVAECRRSPTGAALIESRSGDLKVRLTLQHSKREGTFKRQPSKRMQAVFGRSIEQLASFPSGLIDGIPRIIVKCIQIVEQDGLVETGIYRVCCVTSDLQNLRRQFDRNVGRGEEMLAEKNVHVAANLLKLFFRELPEPLFTSALYQQFLDAIKLTDTHNQRVTLLNTCALLPASYRKILFYLLDHLVRVSQESHKNMMHLENLAVVFGPTLMRPSKLVSAAYPAGSNQRLNALPTNHSPAVQTDLDQMSSELQGSMFQCQVVLTCLKLRRDGFLK